MATNYYQSWSHTGPYRVSHHWTTGTRVPLHWHQVHSTPRHNIGDTSFRYSSVSLYFRPKTECSFLSNQLGILQLTHSSEIPRNILSQNMEWLLQESVILLVKCPQALSNVLSVEKDNLWDLWTHPPITIVLTVKIFKISLSPAASVGSNHCECFHN